MFKLAIKLFIYGLLTFQALEAQASDPLVTDSGTWALQTNRDPFIKSFPVSTYLPAGTLIFDQKPGDIEGYKRVLTHKGFWVQIADNDNDGPNLIGLDILGLRDRTDIAFLHASILCLNQSNEIVPIEGRCNTGSNRTPVGEGWFFAISDSNRSGFSRLTANLDDNTSTALSNRGWDVSLAEFEIADDEIIALERRGLMTLLSREHPRNSFGNIEDNTVLMRCGIKELSQRQIGIALTSSAGINTEKSFLSWLGVKLGIQIDTAAEASKTYSVHIDTTESSYLYYATNWNDQNGDEKIIRIEKEFDCKGGAQVKFGDKISRVEFSIDDQKGLDPTPYVFDSDDIYIAMTDEIYEEMVRPVYISINHENDYQNVVEKLMKRKGISDRSLAEFIVENLNYSCKSERRDFCHTAQSN